MRFLVPPLLALGAAVWVLLYLDRDNAGNGLDDDLCPSDAGRLAGSATLLLDLRKPLDAPHLSLPGDALHDLSLELGAATELRVFALTADADSPRQILARLCKPYDNADLSVPTAKDQRGVVRDCDDLPAQLPARVREAADRFCARRAVVRARINALARKPRDGAVANAYLVAALDDTVLEFADRPAPRALYVFSDMMQHADWYSHLDLEWTDWAFEDFVARREATYPSLGHRAAMAGQHVRIYYVPRRGRTEQPRTERTHKQFWREYFAGAQVAFRDQPAMAAYAASPLMDILTEAEVAARERDEAERLLAQIKQEQAVLAEGQEKQQQERQALEQEIRRREQQLEAEKERLRAEAEERERQRQEAEERRSTEQSQTASVGAEGLDGQPGDDGALAAVPNADSEGVAVGNSGPDGSVGDAEARMSERSPCEVELAPHFRDARYPGRGQLDFGDADVLVHFTVDDEGATVDEEVTIDLEGSSASRPRRFRLFAEVARKTVEQWEFVFENPGDEDCVKRQQHSITFQFRHE